MPTQTIPMTERTPLHPGTLFFCAYLLFFFLSKFSGFLPGYALDDYRIISQVLPNDLGPFYVTQGRFTSAIFDLVVSSAHLRLNDLHVVGLFASAVFSGWFFRTALPFGSSVSRSYVFACGALLGSHPYYTEYVTFRQSASLMAFMYLLCLGAFVAYIRAREIQAKRRGLWLLLSWVLAVLALGVNQLAAAYLCIAVVAYEFIDARTRANPHGLAEPRHFLRATAVAAAYGAAITVGYLVVALLSAKALGQSGNARTELLAMSAIPGRVVEATNLAISIFARNEVVASATAKLAVLAGLVVALLPLNRRRLSSAVLAAVFFAMATLIALLPILVSGTWWPVPRTLIAVVFATVATLCLCQDGSRRQLRIAAFFVLFGSILFAGHSNALLSNQARLNRWDMEKANQIVAAVQTRFPDADRIVLSGASWFHGSAPSIAQGDLNVSALAIGWAIDPLFDEATGQDVHIRTAATEEDGICAGRPAFPHSDSLVDRGDEVLVCLAPSPARSTPAAVSPIEDDSSRAAPYQVFTWTDSGTLVVVPSPAGVAPARIRVFPGRSYVVRAGSEQCGGTVLIASDFGRIELNPDDAPSVVVVPLEANAEGVEASISMADPATPNWNCNVSFDPSTTEQR